MPGIPVMTRSRPDICGISVSLKVSVIWVGPLTVDPATGVADTSLGCASAGVAMARAATVAASMRFRKGERKSVVVGQSVYVCIDLGVRSSIKNNKISTKFLHFRIKPKLHII